MAGIASNTVDEVDATVDSHTDEIIDGIGAVHSKGLGLTSVHISTLYGTHLLGLGLTQSQISIIYGDYLKNLGLIPSHVSIIFGLLWLNFGMTPLHSSTIHSVVPQTGISEKTVDEVDATIDSFTIETIHGLATQALGLGLIPSQVSTTYGVRKLGLGFSLLQITRILRFTIELRFYDRDDNLVKIISSKSQNFPLISPGLEFEFLQDGGCGFFGFTSSEDLNLDYNYKCEIYIYEQKWHTGYITKLPKIGTRTTYEYQGWGHFEQIDWQTIKETYIGDELSVIAEDVLDNYIIGKTGVKKAA